MKAPDIPDNEPARVKKLRSLDILDTAPEAIFDDITHLAAIACGTPYSVISLIDDDRQWFKSIQGPLGVKETSREISFCGHTVFMEDLFVIDDTHQDPRFDDNPVVLDGPKIRFYAGAPLITQDGLALGTLCVFSPEPASLTEPQKTSLKLLAKQVTEKMEQRLNDLLSESMGDVLDIAETFVFMFDPRTEDITYLNPALKKRLPEAGTSNARTLFATLFPDLEYDTLFSDANTADSQPSIINTRLLLPDQTNGSARIRILGQGSDGRNSVVVLFRDDTELLRTRSSEKDAQSHLRLFSQVAMQTSASVVICDSDGRTDWVNNSFETLTGYTLDEIRGKKPGDFLQGPDTSPEARSRISRLLKDELPVYQEILNYTKSGKPFWVELLIEPIRDSTGHLTHFVSTQTDVTERKKHEIDLELSRKTAEQANAAKSQFLAKISHELRTPLNGILGVTESLLEQAPDELQDMVGTVHQSANHLFSLLNDLLELTQFQQGHFTLKAEPVCLPQLLKDVERLFVTRAESVNTSLICDFASDLPEWVETDLTRLKQVLMNLVNNAIKFTRNGKVDISAHPERLHQEQNGAVTVHFSVKDNGPGISEEDQARIFENFEQLDNSITRVHGGSGLGLSISREILKAMGSQLCLVSQPGQGSEFSFSLTLPLAEKPAPVNPVSTQRPIESLANVHAMIVDDNEINCKVLAELLKGQGVGNLYTAPSARRALVMLDNIQPDLLFLDIHMPMMDGNELLKSVRNEFAARGRELPVTIAFTADVSDSQVQECQKAGFDYHLGKPITRSKLQSLLSQIYRKPDSDFQVQQTEKSPRSQRGRILDIKHLKTAFDDDDKLVADFLAMMRTNLPENLTAIEQALDEQNAKAGHHSAHQVKGLVSYFGHKTLFEKAQNLQAAMKDENFKTAAKIFETMKPELTRLLTEIESATDYLPDAS